jgi:hypothetical protein
MFCAHFFRVRGRIGPPRLKNSALSKKSRRPPPCFGSQVSQANADVLLDCACTDFQYDGILLSRFPSAIQCSTSRSRGVSGDCDAKFK